MYLSERTQKKKQNNLPSLVHLYYMSLSDKQKGNLLNLKQI